MSIYDHPSALALAATPENSASGAGVHEHLAACLACRIRAGRLRHVTMPGDPSEDSVARILEASTPGPEILARLTTTHDEGRPLVGEIWRAGRDEAILVWIRRVFDDAVDVVPAVLDIELADQESVILPAGSTPLGLPLALLTGIRGHVGLLAFLERVGFVDASAQVQEAMSAAREDRTPHAIEVGLPIDREDDQRIEYRRVIADLLADLAPSRWETPAPNEGLAGESTNEFADLISRNLPVRHSGVRILPVSNYSVSVNEEFSLSTCLRITYLDTSLIMAMVEGASLEDILRIEALADACLEIIRLEPDTTAVAVTSWSVDWLTVVLTIPQLRTAFEPPGGQQVAPRLTREPLPVVDALAKFLDGQVCAWEVTEPATSEIEDLSFRQLALRSATDAVAEIVAQGHRARTIAKKLAWTNLADDLVLQIAASMTSIAANEPVDAVLDELIERGTQ